MYLRRGARVACWILFNIGLLFTLIALLATAAAAAGKQPDHRGPDAVAAWVTAALFCLPSGIPLLLYYTSQARHLVPQRDILRDHLHLDALAELQGVQFAALPYPDTVAPPSYVALAVFLQNGHDTPRKVEIRVVAPPFRLVDPQDPYRVRLAGGESGVLLILGFASPDAPAGERLVQYRVRVARPGPVGRRVIEKEGASRGGTQAVTLVVRPPRPLGESAGAAGLETRKGYRPIFRPGESAPNEESLDFLTLPA